MTKFYELTTRERIGRLVADGTLSRSDLPLLADGPALPTDVSANMVENQIGDFRLPLGLAEHFLIDGERYLVPLAVEEPSVIAAASNAAGRIAACGGFGTTIRREGLLAQIVFMDGAGSADDPGGVPRDGRVGAAAETGSLIPRTVRPVDATCPTNLDRWVAEHETAIRQVAHDAHPSLKEHGGGLRSIAAFRRSGFLEFDLLVDPGQAMGANVVNTIAEAVAGYCAERLPGDRRLMAILSNKADTQRARSQARIDFDRLATPDMEGGQVARRMVVAAHFADISPLRAATHNKGIMNGVNAVVLATGNDTRSINAAAYADLSEDRRTWTTWSIDRQRRQLVGSIDMSLPLGSVGGAMATLPMAGLSLKILRQPSAERLMGIVASVGLASNLSAMRALVTRGIQAGHMNLQFKSLAISAGALPDELDRVVAALRADPHHAGLAAARQALECLRSQARP